MSHVATCEVTTFSQPVPLNISTRGPNGRPAFNTSKGGVTSHPLTKFGCLWSSVAQTTGRTKHEISPFLGTFHMFTGGYLALQHVWTELSMVELDIKQRQVGDFRDRSLKGLHSRDIELESWWTSTHFMVNSMQHFMSSHHHPTLFKVNFHKYFLLRPASPNYELRQPQSTCNQFKRPFQSARLRIQHSESHINFDNLARAL